MILYVVHGNTYYNIENDENIENTVVVYVTDEED